MADDAVKLIPFGGVRGNAGLHPFLENILEAVDLSVDDLPRLVPRRADTAPSGGAVTKLLALSNVVVSDDTATRGFVWNDVGIFVGSNWRAKTATTNEVVACPLRPSFVLGVPTEVPVSVPDYDRWARSLNFSLIANYDFANGGTNWTTVAGTWTTATPPGRKLQAGGGSPLRGELLSSEAAASNTVYVCSFQFWVDATVINTTDGGAASLTVSLEGTTGGGANPQTLLTRTISSDTIFPAGTVGILNVPVGEINPQAFGKTHVRVRIVTNVLSMVVTRVVVTEKSATLDKEVTSGDGTRTFLFRVQNDTENHVTAWWSTAQDLSAYEQISVLWATFQTPSQPARLVLLDKSGIATAVEGEVIGSRVWYDIGSAPRTQVFAMRWESASAGSGSFSIKNYRNVSGGQLALGCSGSIAEGQAVYIAKAVQSLACGLVVQSQQTDPFMVTLGPYGSARVRVSASGGAGLKVRLYRATGGSYLLVDEKPVTGGVAEFIDNGSVTADALVASDGILPNGPCIVWNGRVVVGVGSKCWFSALGEPFCFAEHYTNETGGWTVQLSAVIVGFSVRDGRCFVYTRDGVWAIVGNTPTEFTLLRQGSTIAVGEKAVTADDVVGTAHGILVNQENVFRGEFGSQIICAVGDNQVACADGTALWLSSEYGWVKYRLAAAANDLLYWNGKWHVATGSGIIQVESGPGRVTQAYCKTGRWLQMPPSRAKWMYVFGTGTVTVTTERGSKAFTVGNTRQEVPLPEASLSRWIQWTLECGANDAIDLAAVLYHEWDRYATTAVRAK